MAAAHAICGQNRMAAAHAVCGQNRMAAAHDSGQSDEGTQESNQDNSDEGEDERSQQPYAEFPPPRKTQQDQPRDDCGRHKNVGLDGTGLIEEAQGQVHDHYPRRPTTGYLRDPRGGPGTLKPVSDNS